MDQWYRRILATLGVILELLIMLALVKASGMAAYVFMDVSRKIMKILLRLVIPLSTALLIWRYAISGRLLYDIRRNAGRVREYILIYLDNRQEYSDKVTGEVRQRLDTVMNVIKDCYENKDI